MQIKTQPCMHCGEPIPTGAWQCDHCNKLQIEKAESSPHQAPSINVPRTFPRSQPETRYTTHPKVVAGVVLIASLLLFGAVFWACMGVSWAASPPEDIVIGTVRFQATAEDYFSVTRIIVSVAIAVVTTGGFWAIFGRDRA